MSGGRGESPRTESGPWGFALCGAGTVLSCSDQKLAFNESHCGTVLGILPGRVSCLKLESGFFVVFFFFKALM